MVKSILSLLLPLLLASLACNVAIPAGESNPNESLLDPARPSVIFLSPQTGNQYALGSTVLLHAEGRDLGAGIAKIEFYDNFDTVIGTVMAPNPQGVPSLTAIAPWQPPTAQTHFIKVKAIRADGTESRLAEVSVAVVPLPAGVILPAVANTSSAGEAATTPQAAPPVESLAVPSAQPAAPVESPVAPSAGGGGGEALPTATPTTEVAPTQVPTVTSLPATVIVQAANVRVRPSQLADPAALLGTGEQVELVFRSEDNLWYAIPMATGGYGWIFADSVSTDGDPSTLPLATTE